MENEENVVPDVDPMRVHTIAQIVMDYLDVLVEEGFTEVEVVTAMLVITTLLSETIEEVIKDDNN
jgi:hypothetical protein